MSSRRPDRRVRQPIVRAVWLAAAAGMLSAPVLAGDPAAGKAKSATCVACHGPEGTSSIPIYPNLAGQKEQYLADALAQYKSGKRDNPIMKPMAAMLSDEDVANLAAYYASLACK